MIWILSGQLYNSPLNSFINFYPDYKLNQYNSIFRTKIINHSKGSIEFINNKHNLYQRLIRVLNNKYSLFNSSLKQLTNTIQSKNYLLTLGPLKYLLKVQVKNSKFYIQLTRNHQLGTLITNTFKTLTGGILYYDHQNLLKCNQINKNIFYINRNHFSSKYKPVTSYRTMVWINEETHKVNCEPNILLVEHGDFISEGFELVPGLFSKTSGIVIIRPKNNLIQTISIKSGLVYEGKKFKSSSKKLYYPGEVIFSNIEIKKLSFCEHITGKNTEQLLVRPVEIYEFSQAKIDQSSIQNKFNKDSNIKLESRSVYSYKSNQKIRGTKNLNLIANLLSFESNKFINTDTNIELFNNKKTKLIASKVFARISYLGSIG